jgi:hypothetical protein
MRDRSTYQFRCASLSKLEFYENHAVKYTRNFLYFNSFFVLVKGMNFLRIYLSIEYIFCQFRR